MPKAADGLATPVYERHSQRRTHRHTDTQKEKRLIIHYVKQLPKDNVQAFEVK
jgi:hypothetical protein